MYRNHMTETTIKVKDLENQIQKLHKKINYIYSPLAKREFISFFPICIWFHRSNKLSWKRYPNKFTGSVVGLLTLWWISVSISLKQGLKKAC